MSKKEVNLIFSGQGSQYVGMAKSLYQESSDVQNLFNRASEVLNFDLAKLCFEGPEADLQKTENTQPALLTHSVALWLNTKNFLEKHNIQIKKVLGHSVGEYAALVVAGALKFEDAVKAVKLRGRYMQEATPIGTGKMLAVLRTPLELIEKGLQKFHAPGTVIEIANLNTPEQFVLSGHKAPIEAFATWVKEQNPKARAIELSVSAPFHCSLMKPASERLSNDLKNIEFSPLKLPYIANVDASFYSSGTPGEKVEHNLIKQIYSSVRWTESIQIHLTDEEVCIELGPGQVLKGLLRKINPKIKVLSLDKEPLENILNILE